MSFTLVALTTLLSGDQVHGLALQEKSMDVITVGVEEVFDSLLNFAQDGVIRIPIKK